MCREDELESGEKRSRIIIDSHEARKETPLWCFAWFGQSWIDFNCEGLGYCRILARDCGWGDARREAGSTGSKGAIRRTSPYYVHLLSPSPRNNEIASLAVNCFPRPGY
jgi:hypothetical protein